MTKEEYLNYRKNKAYYQIFWEYYKEKCDKPLIHSYDDFVLLFTHFLQSIPVNIYNVIEYFDEKYDITTTYIIDTKENKTIGYV